MILVIHSIHIIYTSHIHTHTYAYMYIYILKFIEYVNCNFNLNISISIIHCIIHISLIYISRFIILYYHKHNDFDSLLVQNYIKYFKPLKDIVKKLKYIFIIQRC